MNAKQMIDVINLAKPGDRLEMVFADKTFDGDLAGRLMMIVAMNGDAIQFGEMPTMNLMSVVASGKWEGFRTYTVIILDGFDAEYFIKRTVSREMLESIRLAA